MQSRGSWFGIGPPSGSVTVHLCRISPGCGLDEYDNLRGSLKAPVDQVAAWLGRDDRDPSITWEYSQRWGETGECLVGVEAAPTFKDLVRNLASGKPSGAEGSVLRGMQAGHSVLAGQAVGPYHVDQASPGTGRNPSGTGEEGVVATVNDIKHSSTVTDGLA